MTFVFHQMVRKKRHSTVGEGEGATTTISKFYVTSHHRSFPVKSLRLATDIQVPNQITFTLTVMITLRVKQNQVCGIIRQDHCMFDFFTDILGKRLTFILTDDTTSYEEPSFFPTEYCFLKVLFSSLYRGKEESQHWSPTKGPSSRRDK